METFVKITTGLAVVASIFIFIIYIWLAADSFRYLIRQGDSGVSVLLAVISFVQAAIPATAIFFLKSGKPYAMLWAGGLSGISLIVSIFLGMLLPAIIFGIANP